jgi:hypothetical protein
MAVLEVPRRENHLELERPELSVGLSKTVDDETI